MLQKPECPFLLSSVMILKINATLGGGVSSQFKYKINTDKRERQSERERRGGDEEEEEEWKRRDGKTKERKGVPVERPGNAVRAAIAVAQHSWLWAVVGRSVLPIIPSQSCHTP